MVFNLKLFIGCLILLLWSLVNTFHLPSKFKQYNTQTHCFTTTLVGTFHATSSSAAPPYSPAIHPTSPYLTAKYPIELGITLAGDPGKIRGLITVEKKMRSWYGFVAMIISLMISSRLILSEGIWLNLPNTGTKCVSEEIQNNVVVVADYVVIDEQGHATPTVSAKVTSPYGNTLYHNENSTHGQFAFTTSEIGSYVACFWVDNTHLTATLNLDWKIGIAAKDWDSVAKKEHIEGVELELRKLEAATEAIHENLLYLKNREVDMREVSEKTNARVAWLSIMSLGIGIAASLFQVWHLKHYFQKKKLI